MDGPQHYKAAEELLDIADERDVDGQLMTAMAQVHATLALTAATVGGGPRWFEPEWSNAMP